MERRITKLEEKIAEILERMELFESVLADLCKEERELTERE